MKAPSAQKVKESIEWLKANRGKIRRWTAFGEDNWSKIDAEIEVLDEDLSEDDIENNYDGGGGEWNEGQRDAALGARRWLDGEEKESPKDSWKCLVQK